MSVVATQADEAAELISEAARLVEPEDGEAVFYIRVGGSRTQMRVKTKGNVDPEAALRNAIAALNGEREALSNCPAHRSEAIEELVEACTAAADILESYVEFLHRMPVEDIELHPYIPAVEEAFDKARAAIARATGTTSDNREMGRGL